ncbi:MAG: MFS transporter [bacterium]
MKNKKKFTEGLTRNVVTLGLVSGLTDISSEMLYPIVPIFLTSVLHAPISVVGLIEGTAEATASLLKAAGGRWSDKTSKRKPFLILGYSLSAVSKPLMALAHTWHFVLFSRFLDRTGKGIRTSARDALLASSAAKKHWGKAFGLHRAMDTAGAALGPLIAIFLLNTLHFDYRQVFIIAFAPALLGVLVLTAMVREQSPAGPFPEENTASAGPIPPLSPQFRRFLFFYAIFALGNSSDVFLLLKAKNTGFSTTAVILAYVGYNMVYALAAAPAGRLSDRLGRKKTLAFGFAVFSTVYLGFAIAETAPAIWFLFALYGFCGAFTEGVAKTAVADFSESRNRGTAMGFFHGMTGLLAFAASTAAGLLWSGISPSAPFLLGAACALVSATLIFRWQEKPPVQGAAI